jgi:beta-lactamase regulating signal transducer with metallopeptidase domain
MTDRQAHVGYAAVGVALAIALSKGLDAKLSMSLSEGLWFEVLILVVVAAFLLEPNFSSGSTTTSNTVAAAFVVLGADRSRHEQWWTALLVLSLVAFGAGILSYVLQGNRRRRRVHGWRAFWVRSPPR